MKTKATVPLGAGDSDGLRVLIILSVELSRRESGLLTKLVQEWNSKPEVTGDHKQNREVRRLLERFASAFWPISGLLS